MYTIIILSFFQQIRMPGRAQIPKSNLVTNKVLCTDFVMYSIHLAQLLYIVLTRHFPELTQISGQFADFFKKGMDFIVKCRGVQHFLFELPHILTTVTLQPLIFPKHRIDDYDNIIHYITCM